MAHRVFKYSLIAQLYDGSRYDLNITKGSLIRPVLTYFTFNHSNWPFPSRKGHAWFLEENPGGR